MDGKCDMQYTADLFVDRIFFPCISKVCVFPFARKADTLPIAENLNVLEHLSHAKCTNLNITGHIRQKRAPLFIWHWN
jgi:hypothetical protein